MINLDANCLLKVLSNLISNAIKFTHDGKIEISLRLCNPSDTKNQLSVSVHDSGVGIPEEEIPNLFKEFYTVQSRRDLNPNGIGLGLYICRKVVKLCGGKIYIAKPDQKVDVPNNFGAEFIFTMSLDGFLQ